MSKINETLEELCNLLYGGARGPAIDPGAIPCKETSDEVRLCKSPLVSVRLITYNHEPYLRESIESVLAQKTDFEFELVIGEDCSQDKTREICFEYQRKYPEKIRVLWADENVRFKGGNAYRTMWHCRGEYVAFLEGDDYWTDPYKLQKQLDQIRQHDAVACVACYKVKHQDGSFHDNVYHGGPFFDGKDLARFYPHTSTFVCRAEVTRDYRKRFSEIRGWYDYASLYAMMRYGKIVFLQDIVSCYRITGKGIASGLTPQERCVLSVKQGVDLHLHMFGSKGKGTAMVTSMAFFFKRNTRGWSKDLAEKYRDIFSRAAWGLYSRHPFDLRMIRAFWRFLRFRAGVTF